MDVGGVRGAVKIIQGVQMFEKYCSKPVVLNNCAASIHEVYRQLDFLYLSHFLILLLVSCQVFNFLSVPLQEKKLENRCSKPAIGKLLDINDH